MNKWLSILTLAVPVILYMLTPVPAFSAERDTIKVTSVGENNSVTVNSLQLDHSLYNKVDAPVQGEITQTGENNKVEISTHTTNTPCNKQQTTNNQPQTTNNKQQTTNNKQQTTRQHITVTQTGTNNSVKINSR